MSRGKYLSLEEARKTGRLDRFCKEHPSEGDKELFDRLFEAMAKPKSVQIPTQGGRLFRFDVGRRSDLKPVHRSDLKAATVSI